jgi:DNA-binding Xre family transcriptional regulator
MEMGVNMKIYAKNELYDYMAKRFISIMDLHKGTGLSLAGVRLIIKRKTGVSMESAKKICHFLEIEFDQGFEIVGRES